MIFAHTIENVLNQSKTQTRRLVKPGEHIGRQHTPYIDTSIPYAYLPTIFTESGYAKWALGKTYAAQPGRTQKAVARIRITRIRQEDIRNISDSDVRAEGFTDYLAFLKTWLGMHDKVFAEHLPEKINPVSLISNRHGIRDLVMMRPAEYYLAWVLDFELVTP